MTKYELEESNKKLLEELDYQKQINHELKKRIDAYSDLTSINEKLQSENYSLSALNKDLNNSVFVLEDKIKTYEEVFEILKWTINKGN